MLLVILTGACAVGRGGDDEQGALPDSLAIPAQPLPAAPDGTPITTPGSTGGANPTPGDTTPGSTPTATTGPSGGAGPTTTAVPYATRLDLADRTGDSGLQGRPYTDVSRVRIEDDGTRGRFTVELAGAIPSPLPAEELILMGIDLDQGGDDESEFQLFTEGTSDGWRAWRHDNKKYVEYQGTFEVGGNRLVFTVPWSALGGRKAGKLDVFVEWTKRGLVLADEAKDFAPDRGQAPYRF